MSEVKYLPKEKDVFAFEENGERLAEMIVSVSGKEMSVYHTEVDKRLEGRGAGKKLIEAMSDYAREHELRVTPYCPFVKSQFQKYPDKYSDIYQKEDPKR
jgi:predicted GNAT family acetyltransferase